MDEAAGKTRFRAWAWITVNFTQGSELVGIDGACVVTAGMCATS